MGGIGVMGGAARRAEGDVSVQQSRSSDCKRLDVSAAKTVNGS